MTTVSPATKASDSSTELLIVGGGMAAERLLGKLAKGKYGGRVTLVSAEPHAGYNRVLLPDLLCGRCKLEDLEGNSTAMARALSYQQILGARVTELDLAKKRARCSNGATIAWDTLVLATGSSAAMPNALTIDCNRITPLRTLADVEHIEQLPKDVKRIAVVGGGLLGLEAAHALHLLRYSVTVVHRHKALMNRQLEENTAALLQTTLEDKGLSFRTGVEVESVDASRDEVSCLQLSDGSVLDAEVIVVATGNRPNIELAATQDIACDHGVLINDRLQTSSNNVFAIGECAQLAGKVHAFVEPVYAQADALADQLLGNARPVSLPSPSARLKVAGVELFCAGSATVTTDQQSLVLSDPGKGVYRRLTFLGNELKSAILLGNTQGSQAILRAMGATLPDPQEREQLVFGAQPTHA